MSATPTIVQTPKTPYVQISAANTARDGTGTIGTLYTAGSAGARLEGIQFTATGTTTAGVLRVFLSNDAGSTKRLIAEVLVTAVTPSTTLAVFSYTWIPPTGVLILEASAVVYVATHNAEAFNCFGLRTGDF